MNFELVLLLITSIMMVILSSWNLNTFLRLGNASGYYPNDQEFEDACHVSKTYTTGGKIVAIVMLIVSVGLLVLSSVMLYKK